MKYEFTVLNEDEILRIHETSLRVLGNVGIRVMDDETCATLSRKGLPVDQPQQRVRFPQDMVQAAIDAALPGQDDVLAARLADALQAEMG